MIHKTAIISETSKLADSVEIGAYSIIGPNVKIESNTKRTADILDEMNKRANQQKAGETRNPHAGTAADFTDDPVATGFTNRFGGNEALL